MEPSKRRKGRPKAFYGSASPVTVQALDRGLSVLVALGSGNGMTLSDISVELGQSPATMYRILSTLAAKDFVELDAQKQEWQIGSMTFRLGSSFLRRSGVIERSRPVMRELMEATGETSNLGIETDGEVMFISQVETQESIRAFFPPGTVSPMHASGIGKALLSRHDEARIARFLNGRELVRFTERTISRAEHLLEELSIIRRQGFAFDNEEKAEGMRCVAAPILDMHGEAVAGISISGPAHRLPDAAISRIGAIVREAALKVSRGLGAP
ncbi:MAG TPA: IclR family transcriptional regulator [Albidovulum sp.]|uniref:HTH-type transcriptional regulator BhcR n=1 Tax=Albidovulum sp. TaxID=1872424 RepID=UPI002D18BA3A|nr:IclR family transcriptional regulator [Albidovulum sp.]